VKAMQTLTFDSFQDTAAQARSELVRPFLNSREPFPAFAFLTFDSHKPLLIRLGPDPRVLDVDLLVSRLLPGPIERMRANEALPLPETLHVGVYNDDRFWVFSVSRGFSSIQKSVVTLAEDAGPITHDFDSVALTHPHSRIILPLKDLLYERHPLASTGADSDT